MIPLACAAFVGVVGLFVYLKQQEKEREKERGLYMPRAVVVNERMRRRQLFGRGLAEELKRHQMHNTQMYEVGSGGYNNPFQ